MNNLFNDLRSVDRLGEIEQCLGLKLVSNGPPQVFVGERCEILDTQNQLITQAEVLGFDQGKVILMPFSPAQIGLGYKVRACGTPLTVATGSHLLGRIVDAFAKPIDQQGRMDCTTLMPFYKNKINPFDRQPITERIHTGIHAIDGLLPLGKGQRIGLFAGSGVGKSKLLSMIAKRSSADILVIALIGERGREVNEFILEHLDQATLKRSVVVVACSDDSAVMRRQAVFTAMTISEYFSQQNHDVMLLLDSITRFAIAQRELGMSLGELPLMRGYPPSVFAQLPALIERAGNFLGRGSITALYTVLVEGDDFNEPIADHLRGLLDGHIVLTRELAHQGHYPAIDVLQSVSRLASQLLTPQEKEQVKQITALLNLYQQNKALIDVGAYKPGNNLKLDYAVARIEAINQLLIQTEQDSLPTARLVHQLSEILK